jgi:hypothetical protein
VAGELISTKIAIVGLRDVQKALRLLDPDFAKWLRKQLKESANLAKNAAKSRVPSQRPLLGGSGSRLQSGWRNVWAMNGWVRGGQGWPAWYSSEIKSQIESTLAATNRDRKTLTRTTVAIHNASAAGSIYEFARTDHTKGEFSTRLPHYMGGRIMWAGYDSVAQQVDNKISFAIDASVEVVQRRMDAAKV